MQVITKLRKIVFIMLLSISTLFSEEITWYKLDFPPYLIIKGDYKGSGVADHIEKLVISNFSESNNKFVLANSKRIFSDLASKKSVINPTDLKTREREKIALFSLPYILLLPNGITIRKKDYDKFLPYINSNGELNIKKLLKESNFKIGTSIGRAYGNVIDEEIDCILGYPVEAIYFTKVNNLESKSIISLPIEGMPEYLLGYFAAPKNSWGKND